MKNSLLVSLILLATACGNAKESPRPASSLKEENGLYIKERQAKPAKTIRNADDPRVVARRGTPEIIIKGEQLSISGKAVVIGQPYEIWKQAIPGVPRCDGEHDAACDWDNLGISLIIKGGVVHTFTIFLNLEPWGVPLEKLPDGSPAPLIPDKRPKHVFSGYLEWDGYGIDANTRFRDIRANVAPDRNVRCDLFTNNCGNTTAHFNDYATIYLTLYLTTHETGRLETLSIGR